MAYCLESYCGDTLEVYHDIDSKNTDRHLFEIKCGEKVIVKGSVQL